MHRRQPFAKSSSLNRPRCKEDSLLLPTTLLHSNVRASGYAKSSSFRRRRLSILPVVKYLFYATIALYLFQALGLYVPVHRTIPHPTPNTSGSLVVSTINNSIQITAVVMNYGRPRMLQHSNLLPTLCHHPNIQHIYLCHANNRTKFDYKHVKVHNVDSVIDNARYGLALRFWYCQNAPTDWVLIVDDDMELYESTVSQLIYEFQKHQSRAGGGIVGKYGRSYHYWKVPHRHGYDYGTKTTGRVEVVLTKLLLVEKEICRQFFQYEPLVRDLVIHSRPYWNGEDIFLSLVANVYHNHSEYNNVALSELQAWEAPNSFKDDDGALDINGNMDRHYDLGFLSAYWRNLKNAYYRGWFWSHAKQRLLQQKQQQQQVAAMADDAET